MASDAYIDITVSLPRSMIEDAARKAAASLFIAPQYVVMRELVDAELRRRAKRYVKTSVASAPASLPLLGEMP